MWDRLACHPARLRVVARWGKRTGLVTQPDDFAGKPCLFCHSLSAPVPGENQHHGMLAPGRNHITKALPLRWRSKAQTGLVPAPHEFIMKTTVFPLKGPRAAGREHRQSSH